MIGWLDPKNGQYKKDVILKVVFIRLKRMVKREGKISVITYCFGVMVPQKMLNIPLL